MEVLPKSEAIKVAVRVRPLLSHERFREEVVYYPQGGPAVVSF